MGTRIVDPATGTVMHEAHGTAFTDELERAYVQIDLAVSADRKRDQAQKLIYRLRQSADAIAKLQARLDGMRKAHDDDAAKLPGMVPDGYSVAYEDVAEGSPVLPSALVAPEDAASVPVESPQSTSDKPNRFDAIALEAANA